MKKEQEIFFVVNDYITLKLENGKTNIYVQGKLFNQCKRLVFNFPTDRLEELDEVDSIDEAVNVYKSSFLQTEINITLEQEFVGHCSNLQAWAEYNYDTRLLHSNLSFPLLKKLTEVGDPLAKQVFKKEIVKRLESGHTPTMSFLVLNGYLYYFTKDEINLIFQDYIKNNFFQKDLWILKEFVIYGALSAKSHLKEQVIKKFKNEDIKAQESIYRQGYLNYLSPAELKSFEKKDFIRFKEEVNIFLEQIKQVKGVENAVLVQSDGSPIQSAGVWFSTDKIINVSMAISAIFNIGIYLYPKDLKFILIEGKKAKFLIAPIENPFDTTNYGVLNELGALNDKPEFFIGITTHPNINLEPVFFQIEEWRKKIKMPLALSEGFFRRLPIPLKNSIFQSGMARVNTKEIEGIMFKLPTYSLNLAKTKSMELKKIILDISREIPKFEYAFISVNGGFMASNLFKNISITLKELDKISDMKFSIFRTANKCAWAMKQMNLNCISYSGARSYDFIFNLEKGIFSVRVKKIEDSRENQKKTQEKFEFLRLVLLEFSKKINIIFQENVKFKR